MILFFCVNANSIKLKNADDTYRTLSLETAGRTFNRLASLRRHFEALAESPAGRIHLHFLNVINSSRNMPSSSSLSG